MVQVNITSYTHKGPSHGTSECPSPVPPNIPKGTFHIPSDFVRFESTSERGRDRSKLWWLFEEVRRKSQRRMRYAFCSYCGSVKRARPNDGMKPHALRCLKMRAVLKDNPAYIEILGLEAKKTIPGLVNNPVMKEKLNLALANCIVSSGIPLRFVDNPYLAEFLTMLLHSHLQDFKPMCRQTLSNSYVPKLVAMHRHVYKSNTLMLAVDDWTTRAHEEVVGIVIVEDGTEYLHKVIPLRGERASSEKLYAVVKDAIKDIEHADERICCIITDGAPNAVALRHFYVADHPKAVHLTCVVHSLDRACKHLLGSHQIKGIVSDGLSYNAVFADSNILHERLRAVRLEAGCRSWALGHVAVTRFATIYDVFGRLLREKLQIQQLLEKDNDYKWPNDRTKGFTTDSRFWERLEALCHIIGPICEAIKKLQSSDLRLSDCFVHVVIVISSMLENITHDAFFRHVLYSAVEALRPLFNSFVHKGIFMLAAFLDLRYTMEFSKKSMEIIRSTFEEIVTSQLEDKYEISEVMDLFDHFCERRSALPADHLTSSRDDACIARVAQRLFRIVPHSMSCERCFSLMGFIDSNRRVNLNVETLTGLCQICMANNKYPVAIEEGQGDPEIDSLIDNYDKRMDEMQEEISPATTTSVDPFQMHEGSLLLDLKRVFQGSRIPSKFKREPQSINTRDQELAQMFI